MTWRFAMTRTSRRLEDEDENGVIRDGGVVKVPLMLTDGAYGRRGYASGPASKGRAHGARDASDELALRDAFAARDAAFAGMERRVRDAWKGPDRRAEPDNAGSDVEAAREGYKRYLENAWKGKFYPSPATAGTPSEELAERLGRDWAWRVSHL
jgi:hypothetical protein